MTKYNWTIAFDADDTLWHNERDFAATFHAFAQMMSDHISPEALQAALSDTERRNLKIYGFGVKGYILSAVETAIEVTQGEVDSTVIARLLGMGRQMLAEPVSLIDGVRQALEGLPPDAQLIVITKGDLIDQERKLAQSGLGDLFEGVDIVSDKTADTYAHIFARHDTAHQMMVGNSLRSDVIPALAAGVWGVHVPHSLTWDYEHADAPVTHRHFRQINSLAELPSLIDSLTAEHVNLC